MANHYDQMLCEHDICVCGVLLNSVFDRSSQIKNIFRILMQYFLDPNSVYSHGNKSMNGINFICEPNKKSMT